jgi:phospholipid/cholesterol/gamma-HCH transport system substrate-binding protein
MVDNLNTIVSAVKNGEGSIGYLLKDTSFATNLNQAVLKIKKVGDEANVLADEISKIVVGLQADITNGKGIANTLLKDSGVVLKLNTSLDNIQKGTDGFNQNM